MFGPLNALTMKAKLIAGAALLAIMSTAVITTGFVYYNKGVNVSKVELAKYETKVANLEAKLATTHAKIITKVVTEYVERKVEVEKLVYKNNTIIEYRVPEQFKLSQGWIHAYNQSVLGLAVDPTKASVAVSSTVSDKKALETLSINNGICLAKDAQIIALQTYIKETQEAYENLNNHPNR